MSIILKLAVPANGSMLGMISRNGETLPKNILIRDKL